MNILGRIAVNTYDLALRHGLARPEVIALMDGGICSQMHQYLLGRIFSDKGYKVSYDLSFFRHGGMDMDGKHTRNFDLPKAFPYIEVQKAPGFKVRAYRDKYFFTGNNTHERTDDFSFLEKTPPVYLGGYYHWPAKLWLPAFRSSFRLDPSVLDDASRQLFREIKNRECPVAVHVRRGDLAAHDLWAYGKPASVEYFRSGIEYIHTKASNPHFYFFSDEPAWVKDELVPTLGLAEEKYSAVSANGPDKGYMDLFLMAACRHTVTSKGTMGKYSALLGGGDTTEKIVILCDDTTELHWKDFFCNPVFL